MSDGMDLSLPPPSDACISCAHGTLQVEPHTDLPIPSQRRLDLVHSNVIGLFLPAINGARYLVSLLDDDTKNQRLVFSNENPRYSKHFGTI